MECHVNTILEWTPLLWLVRLCVLVALSGCFAIACLYCARFFLPRNIRRLVSGELPTLENIAILGNQVKLNGDKTSTISEQVSIIEARLAVVENSHNGLLEHLDAVPQKLRPVHDE
jgi:hypothetical protein